MCFPWVFRIGIHNRFMLSDLLQNHTKTVKLIKIIKNSWQHIKNLCVDNCAYRFLRLSLLLVIYFEIFDCVELYHICNIMVLSNRLKLSMKWITINYQMNFSFFKLFSLNQYQFAINCYNRRDAIIPHESFHILNKNEHPFVKMTLPFYSNEENVHYNTICQ